MNFLEKSKKYFKEFKVIFILVLVALTIKSSLIEIYVVPTGSMEDEILVGDLMIGNKFTYGMRTPDWIGIPYTRMGFYIPSLRLPKFKKIQNGDVAMFEFPRDPFQKYVKRCIGIASDTIQIKKGNIYINDKKMTFPSKAKHITFQEADLDKDGKILGDPPIISTSDGKGKIFNFDDKYLRNSENAMRWDVAINKIFTISNKNPNLINSFNQDTIIFDKDYQANPYKVDYSYKNKEGNASIQSQYINNQVYPYFTGNGDNMETFVVPYKGMTFNIQDWFEDKNEWISFITLLVQDKNKVTLGDVEFIMEDPESVAQISGILWYKIFPNRNKQRENYLNKKIVLKNKNKNKKVDNPWYIYENPISMEFSGSSILVNSNIWDSFVSIYNPNELLDIINNKYNGDQISFVLDFYKKFADSYIKKN